MNIEYLKPVYTKKEIVMCGCVKEVPNEREAVMEGFIYDESETLCTRSTGVFALFSPDVAKRLKIMAPQSIDAFSELLGMG